MREDLMLIFILLAFIGGIVYGERQQCKRLDMGYNWDYGTCIRE